MKNKIVRPLIAGLVLGTAVTVGAFAAAPTGEIPVWRQLEQYSQKDKSFTESRRPQLESIEKEMDKLTQRAAAMTEKERARLSELDTQRKALAGVMAEHEFTLSNDVAQFATARSKEAKSKLAELKGGAPSAPAMEGQPRPGQPETAPSPKSEIKPAQSAEQKAMTDFETNARKERDALLEELKKLPLDPEEIAFNELKVKLQKIAAEEEAKIRLIPPGPKKLRLEAFEKKIQAERKALQETFQPAAPAKPAPAKGQS